MQYNIEITRKALKFLEKIDSPLNKRLRDKIRDLKTNPHHHGAIKLSGKENTYRTRVGKYRIIYEIYDSKLLILVVVIDHRKDVY